MNDSIISYVPHKYQLGYLKSLQSDLEYRPLNRRNISSNLIY